MKFQYILPILFVISLLAACNLTQDVDLDLPDYDPQPVVECYLESGEPYRLLLTRSYAFFEPIDTSRDFIENILEGGATVIIRYDGKTILLGEGTYFNFFTGKGANYGSSEIVPEDFVNDFELDIVLADGETITGKTTIPLKVPIDSVVLEFESDAAIDTMARALTYFTDPDPSVENRFRRQFHWNSLTEGDSLQQDFISTDQFADNGRIVFGTGFDYPVGDTIWNTVFNMNRDYSDFLESVQISIQSNGNPFGQPSGIDSNLDGSANALGIFTGLSYDRVMTIIEK